MKYEKEIIVLPQWVQRDYRARLQINAQATPHYGLVDVFETTQLGGDSGKVNVLILDKDEIAKPLVQVAFTWSTGDQILLDENWVWRPPYPWKGVAPLAPLGHVELVLNNDGVVKDGEPGGINVWIFDPKVPSTAFIGAGMQGDHTGLWLIFKEF
jgi:hypothetical protein